MYSGNPSPLKATAMFVGRNQQRVVTDRRRRHRYRTVEQLESRDLLAIGEGTPLTLNEVIDTAGLAGGLSASIDWGDGTVTPGSVSTGGRLVGGSS